MNNTVTYQDIARHWGISVATARNWVSSGRLDMAPMRVGRYAAFDEDAYHAACLEEFGRLPPSEADEAPAPRVDSEQLRKTLHAVVGTAATVLQQASAALMQLDDTG